LLRFLDSLIFNNEMKAYKGWALFLISLSILVLIAGVVLLTIKKPDPMGGRVRSATLSSARSRNRTPRPRADVEAQEGVEERGEEQDVLWGVGDASDDDEGEDEDIDHHQHPLYSQDATTKKRIRVANGREETVELISTDADDIDPNKSL